MAYVKFYRGDRSKYPNSNDTGEPIADGIFFATDTQEILMHGKSYGNSIKNIKIKNGKIIITMADGTKKKVTIPNATEDSSGFMSPEDKKHLDELYTNITKWETLKVDVSSNYPDLTDLIGRVEVKLGIVSGPKEEESDDESNGESNGLNTLDEEADEEESEETDESDEETSDEESDSEEEIIYPVTQTQIWKGQELTFRIPAGCDYYVTANPIQGYKTPTGGGFTAFGSNIRSVVFDYTTTAVTLTVLNAGKKAEAVITGTDTTCSNINCKFDNTTEEGNCSFIFTDEDTTRHFKVEPDTPYKIEFKDSEDSTKPSDIDTVATKNQEEHIVSYKRAIVSLDISSTEPDFNYPVNITLKYKGNDAEREYEYKGFTLTGVGSVEFYVPYGVEYTIHVDKLDKYDEITDIVDIADFKTKSHNVCFSKTDHTDHWTILSE